MKDCLVKDCSKPPNTYGLCKTHIRRWRKRDVVLPAQREHFLAHGAFLSAPKSTCSVDACNEPLAAKTLCRTHLNRKNQRGEDDWICQKPGCVSLPPKGKPLCDDCTKPEPLPESCDGLTRDDFHEEVDYRQHVVDTLNQKKAFFT